MNKLKVAVIFGGRSGEHEVSLVSATSVIKALNPAKYTVTEIGITHDGEWFTGANCLEKFKKNDYSGLKAVMFDTKPNAVDFDVAFPILHGPFGEDGTIQGLFEMLQIPYVGCGVLASSTAMDKLQCKAILQSAGISVVPYVGFNRKAWQKEQTTILHDIEKNIGIPCFVKPANMGSSVGISKAKSKESLIDAINFAAKFDSRILVEKAINARELECAILGNNEPIAAPVGEIIVGGEFYDYFDKYVDGKSSTQVPADIDNKIMKKLQEMSLKAYKLLDCSGLARVDSFLDRDSGEIYINELNTMPGFTSISMYPKMMAAHGFSYEQLVDKLIELGLEKFEDKKANQIVFDAGSDWYKK
jgi:D-alanine-D-alanine ligase